MADTATPDSMLPEDREDGHKSLAERRSRRLNRRLPMRFRDILPEPPPALPPSSALDRHDTDTGAAETPTSPPPMTQGQTPSSSPSPYHAVVHRLRQIFRTPRNVFSLFRQYRAEALPTHDPEECIELDDLTDFPANQPTRIPAPAPSQGPFNPYPNENSFRLGEWYWNDGVQKSQSGFKQLIGIVGDPDFRPSDVRGTKWDCINRELGGNELDGEWLDEDAGWIKTSVTIPVPFNRRAVHPGVQHYVAADFYHRSLVSVIREKLANPSCDRQFHYEPYELYWQRHDIDAPSRVYGELYTSPAFVEAHQELQNSPGVPGCDLERVVVGLMFWSDATHLASFSSARLWPLYLFFGNESKYRRCKPSCHLCSHVAYFQNVCHVHLRQHAIP
jgi:hypothetical protein